MSLKKIDPTKTKSWDNLNSHYKTIKSSSISGFFKENPLGLMILRLNGRIFMLIFQKI